ncbi:hypothetical protein J6TS2_48840 [Heyndrickxia sporothermodurans]|nr:hypothetical protein J6TS2_48840 [Heyndrickxia sporothermodurans]
MIRDLLDIYNRNIINIIIVSLVLVIPVTIFLLLANNFMYEMDLENPNLSALFLIILNFTMLFPPFFFIAWKDMNDQDFKLREVLKEFVNHFGYIFAFTLLFYLLAIYGAVLLFIPTFIGLSMILLIPLFTNRNTIKESLFGAWKIIKEENFFLLIDLVIIISLNLLAWSGMVYLVGGFENNMLVFIILRSLINALVFPILYIYLAVKYRRESY